MARELSVKEKECNGLVNMAITGKLLGTRDCSLFVNLFENVKVSMFISGNAQRGQINLYSGHVCCAQKGGHDLSLSLVKVVVHFVKGGQLDLDNGTRAMALGGILACL